MRKSPLGVPDPMSQMGINALQAPQGAMPQSGASQTYVPQQAIANASPEQLTQMPVQNAQVSPQGTDNRTTYMKMLAQLLRSRMG